MCQQYLVLMLDHLTNQSHQRYLSLLMEAICGEAEDVRRVRKS